MTATTYVTHVLDVYDLPLHLATTKRGWGQLQRKYPGAFGPIEADDIGGQTSYLGSAVCFYIGPTADDAQRLMILAHEATHAAGAILAHRGIALADDAETGVVGSEALAYLVGWLARWLWNNTSKEIR